MSRAFAQLLRISNPSSTPRRDADNTTDLPGEPQEVDATGDLWQLQTVEVDDQGTVLADWEGIFPPGTPLTPASEVRDVATGAWFRVHGQPEPRRSLLTGQLDHIGARLKYLSDRQGAPA